MTNLEDFNNGIWEFGEQRIHHEDPSVAFTTESFNLGAYKDEPEDSVVWASSDFRSIDTDKLLTLGIFAKYPGADLSRFDPLLRSKKIEGLFANRDIELADIEQAFEIFPQELISIEGARESLTPHWIHEQYRRLGVDYLSTVSEAQSALRDVVWDLFGYTDPEIYQRVMGILDDTSFNVSAIGSSDALITRDGSSVNLSMLGSLADANLLCNTMGIRITKDILKALVVHTVAHELGHIVEWASNWSPGEVPFQGASLRVEVPSDYPFQFNMSGSLKQVHQSERFAQFFSAEVIKKLGINTEITEDLLRIFISMSNPELLRKITPKKASELMSEVAHKYDERDPIRLFIERYFGPILRGHCVAQLYPMSKEEVVEGMRRSATIESRMNRLHRGKMVKDFFEKPDADKLVISKR